MGSLQGRIKGELDMDYEKKYNEALERFKTFREKYCTYGDLHFGDVIFDKTGEAQKDLDAIFPELKESGDERMIKAIEHILYENYSDAAVIEGVEIAEIVTWLEKHKEPIDPFDTKLFQDGVKEGRRLEREDIKKEQQPAEWSKEDEKIRRNLMSLLANMRGNRITEETYQKYYPWLKDFHPSWKPSEEQIKALYCALNDAISLYSDKVSPLYEEISRTHFDALESLYNDLKKLI